MTEKVILITDARYAARVPYIPDQLSADERQLRPVVARFAYQRDRPLRNLKGMGSDYLKLWRAKTATLMQPNKKLLEVGASFSYPWEGNDQHEKKQQTNIRVKQ